MCMSRDPVTGDPGTIVVNAAYGLGELVVSGLVTPDDYRLARADGRLMRFEPGYKDIMLVMGADGIVELPVPVERQEARVLDDALLAALHDGLLRCERELGRPADCEFSIVDGARRVAAVPPHDRARDPDPTRDGRDSRSPSTR